MDVELLLHGVPLGQDYYGIKEEHANMELFYDNSTEAVKYVIETKKSGNVPYAYYSYLRYKGIVGAGGRPGAYFGMTLRLDCYYQDAMHIFSILDMLFKRCVVGTILSPHGDGYKYIVSQFSSKVPEIDKMQQTCLQLIQLTCIPTKSIGIDDSFLHPISAVPTGNMNDVTESTIMASLRKYSKVAISPEYESTIEKQLKKQIQETEAKVNSVASEKEKQIVANEEIVKSLKTKIEAQQNQVSTLEQELKKKETDIQQQRQKNDVAQQVAKVKEPIIALAEYFRIKDSQTHHHAKSYGHNNFRLGILTCGISVIVLVLCLVSLFRSPSVLSGEGSGELQKQISSLKNETKNLTQENNKLQEIINLKNDTIANLRKSGPISDKKKLVIDVNVKKGAPLVVGNEYKLTLKNGTKNYTGEGQWNITNATIKGDKSSSSSIVIIPQNEGNVTIEFKPSDKQCICDSRTIKVNQPQLTQKMDITINPKVDYIEVGKEYTFSVVGYEGKGMWKQDGLINTPLADVTDITKHSITIKVEQCEGKDKATISFTQEGDNAKKVSKTFPIKTE